MVVHLNPTTKAVCQSWKPIRDLWNSSTASWTSATDQQRSFSKGWDLDFDWIWPQEVLIWGPREISLYYLQIFFSCWLLWTRMHWSSLQSRGAKRSGWIRIWGHGSSLGGWSAPQVEECRCLGDLFTRGGGWSVRSEVRLEWLPLLWWAGLLG